jgi:hypothetical protein
MNGQPVFTSAGQPVGNPAAANHAAAIFRTATGNAPNLDLSPGWEERYIDRLAFYTAQQRQNSGTTALQNVLTAAGNATAAVGPSPEDSASKLLARWNKHISNAEGKCLKSVDEAVTALRVIYKNYKIMDKLYTRVDVLVKLGGVLKSVTKEVPQLFGIDEEEVAEGQKELNDLYHKAAREATKIICKRASNQRDKLLQRYNSAVKEALASIKTAYLGWKWMFSKHRKEKYFGMPSNRMQSKEPAAPSLRILRSSCTDAE